MSGAREGQSEDQAERVSTANEHFILSYVDEREGATRPGQNEFRWQNTSNHGANRVRNNRESARRRNSPIAGLAGLAVVMRGCHSQRHEADDQTAHDKLGGH